MAGKLCRGLLVSYTEGIIMSRFIDFNSNNKDTHTEDEGHRLRVRSTLLMVLFGCLLLGFFSILYQLQVVDGAQWRANANYNITQTETVDGVRGEILDRYGRVLVSNSLGYSVELDTASMGDHVNEVISQLLELCEKEGVEWSDTLPISKEAPWTYTKDENLFAYRADNDDGTFEILPTQLGKLAEKYKWVKRAETAQISAQELMEAMCETFSVETETLTPQVRALLGVLYEVALRQEQITYNTYTFATDVSISFITQVKELGLPGVSIVTSTNRVYNTKAAAHVLGRIGLISAEEWPTYQALNYPMNAYVGKDGVELAFESYLHGTSGTRLLETDENGAVVSQQWQTEPQPGNHVVLTLDSELQAHTEQLLGDFVSGLSDPAGAAAVMVDMSGGVLALASYPTYDLSTYSEDYNDLLTDPAKPLLNRATQGVYAPGSIFKMVTAVGGLSEGLITPSSTTYCSGIYTYYPDYRPVCWIYTNTRGNHGSETVSEAIKDSCNIFFYDLGRRLGIDKLVDYATAFGLGQYTGIELPESKGTVAGPETAEKLGDVWYAGQTLSAAIGQSDNQFTPIQLANYVATLVNGGNRYETHLLKEVKSSDYSQVVYEHEPKLASTIDIDPEDLAAVKQGMYDLSQTASMARYFDDLPVSVGCKTGTAEVSGSDATATFVCFAPYDDPQVALCLVAEKGSAGGNLAALAASMLEEYFSNEDNLSVTDQENTLLH